MVRLPRRRARGAGRQRCDRRHARGGKLPASSPRMLVVDDNADAAEMLAEC